MRRFFFLLLVSFLCNYFSSFGQIQYPGYVAKDDSVLFQRYIDSAELYESTHPDSAGHYYKKAQSIAIQKNNKDELSLYFLHYIQLLNKQGNFEKALALSQEHIKTAQELHDDHTLMLAYNEAANEY